ncbi:MAG TPA: hypothetical protein PKN99_07800 [Cyclobacteriaceae bacterium]|nr:hypothetical protein [Cyclobacteriaceae bacterium]
MSSGTSLKTNVNFSPARDCGHLGKKVGVHLTKGYLALVQREVHTVAVDTSHRSKEHLSPVQKEVDTGAVVT